MTKTGTLPRTERVLSRTDAALVLTVLALCSFSFVFSNQILSPILVDISREYRVNVGISGQLNTSYGLAAALGALLIGPLLDHLGRRRILTLGMVLLALGTFASALAPTYYVLLMARLVAGAGSAVTQPAVHALTGDLFAYEHRGRAIGFVLTGSTLSHLLGIPAGTLVAQFLSWRWTFLLLGLIVTLVLLAVLWRLAPWRETVVESGVSRSYWAQFGKVLRHHQAMALLSVTFVSAIGFFVWQTYMGAFFIQRFNLSTGALAPIIAAFGVGALSGAYLGGYLGDRLGKKLMGGIALLSMGITLIIITNALIALWVAIALVVLLAIPHPIRQGNTVSLATEIMPEERGTMAALNIAMMRFGMMAGAVVGGLALLFGSYETLGQLSGGFFLLSVLILFWGVSEPGSGRKGVARPTAP